MNIREIAFFLLLIVLVCALYWPSLGGELIWDSKALMDNVLLHNRAPLYLAFHFGYWEPTTSKASRYDYYRPFTVMTFMVERALWGLRVKTLHLGNLFLFVLILLISYLFFRRQQRVRGMAMLATALFAFYPLQVDNVIWLVGRGDLLLLLCSLLALLFFDFYLEKQKNIFVFLIWFCFLAALFAKEAAIFFLLLFFFYEWCKRRKISLFIHLFNLMAVAIYFLCKAAVVGNIASPFKFFPTFIGNLRTVLAVLGYYFRSLLFPFYYDMFVPVDQLNHGLYWLAGLVMVLVFGFLFWHNRGQQKNWLPYGFMAIFIFAHIYLIFTAVFPFSISTRYLLVPAVGFCWILAELLLKLPKRVGIALSSALLFLFALQVMVSGRAYRSEFHFWQRILHSAPNNSFILFKNAQCQLTAGNYFEAEVLLKKALTLPLKMETAASIAITYAQIELNRAEYAKAIQWLDRTSSLQLYATQELIKEDVRAAIFSAKNQLAEAEAVLWSTIKKYDCRPAYERLYRLYVGHLSWEKAKKLEMEMKKRFSQFRNLNVSQLSVDFAIFSTAAKIRFFGQYGNFHEARRLLEQIPGLGLDGEILLAKYCYWDGEEAAAKKLVHQLSEQHALAATAQNKIGLFYLQEMFRANEAIYYFRKSLAIAPNQPEIVKMIAYLLPFSSKEKPLY